LRFTGRFYGVESGKKRSGRLTMTYKGYLSGWKDNKSNPNLKNYTFTSNPNLAVSYESADEAATECRFYDSVPISILSNEGGNHTLRGFKYEKLGVEKFVIYCEGPYIPEILKRG
jgi:hypothetical protein